MLFVFFPVNILWQASVSAHMCLVTCSIFVKVMNVCWVIKIK